MITSSLSTGIVKSTRMVSTAGSVQAGFFDPKTVNLGTKAYTLIMYAPSLSGMYSSQSGYAGVKIGGLTVQTTDNPDANNVLLDRFDDFASTTRTGFTLSDLYGA